MKYSLDFKNFFGAEKVFTFKDARRFLKKLNASDQYIKLFIHNLVEKKEIKRVSKGVYTFSSNEAVIGFGFSPFYYGLGHALTIRKLWTQISDPIIITTTKSLPGPRESMNERIFVKRISKTMFFGFDYIKYSGIFVPVSDLEKTIMDFVYYKIGIDNQEIKCLLKDIDKDKLSAYMKMTGIRSKTLDQIVH